MQAVIVFCVFIGSPVQEEGSPSAVEAPSAAKLVTEARRQTDWIYKIKTLHMQTRHKTIRSPAKVQGVRNRFRRSNQSEFDDIEAAIAERPSLQTEESSFETTTWTREKYFHRWKTGRTDNSVSWDGVVGISRAGWFDPDKEPTWSRLLGQPIGDRSAFGYFYSVIPEEWVRSGFDSKDIVSLEKRRQEKQPLAEKFSYLGRADYHGRECHFIWRADGTNATLAIDVETGRFRGQRYVSMTYDTAEQRKRRWSDCVQEHFASKGRKVPPGQADSLLKNRKDPDHGACMQLAQQKRAKLALAATLADTRPTSDLVSLKEREVRPGCWFPIRERYVVYGADGAMPTETLTRDVFRLQVDAPIADESTFQQIIPADAKNVRELQPRRPRQAK